MKTRIRQKSIVGISPNFGLGFHSNSLLLIVLATLILTFGLIKPEAISGLRIAVTDILSPVVSLISSPFKSLADTFGNVSGMASLRAENLQLKSENARLKEWYQTALMLQAENQSLQSLLNLKVNPAHKYITAKVLSDAGNAFVKTVVINSGIKNGVRKDFAVLSGEGMIGRVIEVGKNASRVLLITDVNSRIPILIEGSQQKAIMAGDNSDFPVLKHLSRDSSLKEGARIVTSGDGGVFPFGFPIGRLIKLKDSNYAVKPFVNTDKITYVRIADVPSSDNLIRGSLSVSP